MSDSRGRPIVTSHEQVPNRCFTLVSTAIWGVWPRSLSHFKASLASALRFAFKSLMIYFDIFRGTWVMPVFTYIFAVFMFCLLSFSLEILCKFRFVVFGLCFRNCCYCCCCLFYLFVFIIVINGCNFKCSFSFLLVCFMFVSFLKQS